MSDAHGPSGRLWRYRFSQPDATVVEDGELGDDQAAEERAHQLSSARQTPIVVHRHSAHVDAWEYVSEADART